MALLLDVYVAPSSKKQAWLLSKEGRLKCFLKSAPEKGHANKELVKMLANDLRIAQSCIEIISGHTNKKKRIKIHHLFTYEQVLYLLGLDQQLDLPS